jgi:hypothetical protein
MGFVRNLVGGITGSTAANAAKDSAQIQADSGQQAIEEIRRSTAEGQAFLEPFQQIGQQGLDQSSFLTDPQEQFDFLQNNPLFQMGLDNANTVTQQSAAARGRLSSGDTLQQLTNNSLLTAAPLIADQKNSIQNLLNQGLQTAQGQGNIAIGQGSNIANTTTDIGAALAAGQVGAANARSQGAQNILSAGSQIAGLFSDPVLKENIELIGTKNGFNIYAWDWNELATDKLGLNGSSEGVMADQVKVVMPEAVQYKDGFMQVDYSMIGVH